MLITQMTIPTAIQAVRYAKDWLLQSAAIRVSRPIAAIQDIAAFKRLASEYGA